MSKGKTRLPVDKEPIEGCDHIWKFRGYWDGHDGKGHHVDEKGYIGGPMAICTHCERTQNFRWSEWYAIPEEKKLSQSI